MSKMEAVSESPSFVDSSSIPIEVVDDDELAAIETAFLCAASCSQSYAPSSIRTPPLPRSLSLAESANSWLMQCLDVRGSGVCSKSLVEVSTCSSKISSPSNALSSSCCKDGMSIKCHEKAASLSALDEVKCERDEVSDVKKDVMRITAQAEHPQGQAAVRDIEDIAAKTQAEDVPPDPKPRCLSVTDFTAFEWCEKQVEFTKRLGKPKRTEAMRAGSARHAELEIEVLKKVEVEITSKEDSWAMRLINFITGARQMLSEGMTRELPVVGLIGGAWVIGIIDELKLCDRDGMHRPQLIDTKTRNKPTPPSPPQKQNGRMQLMVYKCLWDNIVTSGVPFGEFFGYFRLRPQHLLSEDIRAHAAEVFPDAQIKNLQDVARMYSQECVTFPESHSLLLLRYEWQADRSLLGQDEFDMEREWLEARIAWHLEFWHGLREPAYVPEDEAWKCRYCAFAELCPGVQTRGLGNHVEPKNEDQSGQSQKPQQRTVPKRGLLKYFKKDSRTHTERGGM